MKKIMFLFIGFIAGCAVVGNSAEPSPASSSVPQVSQPPAKSSPTLPAKLEQVRLALSEIKELLKQEDKILAGMQEQKKKAKENEALLKERDRAIETAKQEIQKLRDQLKEAEKELVARIKQAERYRDVQAEYDKAQKERQDDEAKAQEAEAKLVKAQENLAGLKNKFAEAMKRVEEAKKRSSELENTAAVLKAERTRRAEALPRAENAVAMAEKAEKERLILAGRLAELEQSLSQQSKDLAEQTRIEGEIEKERKIIQETEGKIKGDEKAREEAEKVIGELKKQLRALKEAAREGEKEKEVKSLQAQLADARKQRADKESRLKSAEEKLRENEKSIADLKNTIAAVQQAESNQETTRTITSMRAELANETTLLNETEARIDKQSRNIKTAEEEKNRLSKQLLLAREKSKKENKDITGDLDEIKSQLAGQKKLRLEAEARLQTATQKLAALENEKDQLKQALTVSPAQPQQGLDEKARIERETENEKNALVEAENKIKRNEKAREEAEKVIGELKKQLRALKEAAREGEKEKEVKSLQAQLADARKQRADGESRLKSAEEKLRENEKSIADLKNTIAAVQQAESNQETTRTIVNIRSEMANEGKLLAEIENRIKKEETTFAAADKIIAELKKQQDGLEKARLKSEREGHAKRLQTELEEVRKKRADAGERLKETEAKNKEAEQSLATLSNMVVTAERQQEKDKETAKSIVVFEKELKDETALLTENIGRLDQQNRNIKALEDEKNGLNQRLILVKEMLGREEQKMNKLDETRQQIAEQKKIRADMENKLQQLALKQEALEKEKEKLNLELVKAGNLILKNEKDFQKAGRIGEELQKEKELARESASLLQEKELSLKKDADEKAALRDKLVRAEAKLAQQDKEKKKAYQEQVAEAKGKDTLALEQDILNKARATDLQSSKEGTGSDQRQAKKTGGSRSRQSKLEQAEEHYALGIQKWDKDDMTGAIAEFEETIRLNPDAAGAYYNISLAYLRQGNKQEACNYAYQAGECYLKINNPVQATRMAVLLVKIDKDSPLISALRNRIVAASNK